MDLDQLVNKDIILKEKCFLIIDDKKLPFIEEYIKITSLEKFFDLIEENRIYGNIKRAIIFSYAFYYELINENYESIEEIESSFDKAKNRLSNIDGENQNLTWTLNILGQIFKQEYTNLNDFKLKFLKLSKGIDQYFINSYKEISKAIHNIYDNKKIFHMGYFGYEKYLYDNVNNWVYISQMDNNFIGPRNLSYQIKKTNNILGLTKDSELSSLFRYVGIDALFINPIKVCANGDVLAESGTYNCVVLAMAHNIPVICISPKSVFDIGTMNGSILSLDELDEEELLEFSDGSLENISVFNPKYNMINNEFITEFITEDGILYPPFEEKIVKALGD